MIKTVRINLIVSLKVRRRLEQLAGRDDSTMTEAFRKAISLYELVSKHTGAVILRHKDGSEETVKLL